MNQAIVVTGGSSGIGHQAILVLAAEGTNIIVADSNVDLSISESRTP